MPPDVDETGLAELEEAGPFDLFAIVTSACTHLCRSSVVRGGTVETVMKTARDEILRFTDEQSNPHSDPETRRRIILAAQLVLQAQKDFQADGLITFNLKFGERAERLLAKSTQDIPAKNVLQVVHKECYNNRPDYRCGDWIKAIQKQGGSGFMASIGGDIPGGFVVDNRADTELPLSLALIQEKMSAGTMPSDTEWFNLLRMIYTFPRSERANNETFGIALGYIRNLYEIGIITGSTNEHQKWIKQVTSMSIPKRKTTAPRLEHGDWNTSEIPMLQKKVLNYEEFGLLKQVHVRKVTGGDPQVQVVLVFEHTADARCPFQKGLQDVSFKIGAIPGLNLQESEYVVGRTLLTGKESTSDFVIKNGPSPAQIRSILLEFTQSVKATGHFDSGGSRFRKRGTKRHSRS